MPPSATGRVSFLVLFAAFGLMNGLGTRLSHIDDTDETFGYWEVLHYLLYGRGMQTWEYSPEYAIRTYSFMSPMYICGRTLIALGATKLEVFHGVRLLLGLFSALAQTEFVLAIQCSNLGGESPVLVRLTAVFLLFSPGVFFSSTSFLPSAVASSCVMFCCARWLSERFISAIFWGSLAVLMTGWPFVGVILFPLGLHMLWHRFLQSSWKGVGELVVGGVAVAFAVATLAGVIDAAAYRRITSPTLNILMYNVWPSSDGGGDELYGTAPVGYYVRNLLINMGMSWPLAIACPVMTLREIISHLRGSNSWNKGRTLSITLQACVLLWLCVLFSRPHKEERFLYPAYSILALMAAQCAVDLIEMVGGILTMLFGKTHGVKQEHRTINELLLLGRRENKASSRLTAVELFKYLCLVVCLLSAVTMGFSRVTSNSNNFGGYMELWRDLGQALAEQGKGNPSKSELTVCTGREWYFFPSHFFLPQHTRLAFVRDSFHGQLPQLFREGGPGGEQSWIGLWSDPLQPFNKMNKEEMSRYVDISSCDYVVALVDHEAEQHAHGPMVRAMELAVLGDSSAPQIPGKFSVMINKPVLDPSRSPSALARAFHIPMLSKRLNIYNMYTAFSKHYK